MSDPKEFWHEGTDEPLIVYECGICGHFHPWYWNGDCRDDENRFTLRDIEEMENESEKDVEIRTMTDRLEADGYYTPDEAEKVRQELDDYV